MPNIIYNLPLALRMFIFHLKGNLNILPSGRMCDKNRQYCGKLILFINICGRYLFKSLAQFIRSA